MKVITFEHLGFWGFFVGWEHCGSNLGLGAGEILKISLFVAWLCPPRDSFNNPFIIFKIVLQIFLKLTSVYVVLGHFRPDNIMIS